jgi:hypothetical protein
LWAFEHLIPIWIMAFGICSIAENIDEGLSRIADKLNKIVVTMKTKD